MSNEKQTAVDLLIQTLFNSGVDTIRFMPAIEQAKALEKQKIVEAYQDGRSDQHSNEPQFYNRNSEYYYSQTYNQ